MASLRRCTSLGSFFGAKVSNIPLPFYAITGLSEPRALLPKTQIQYDAATAAHRVSPGLMMSFTAGHRIGQGFPSQGRRFAHTDVANVPSFDHYRHDSNKSPVAAGEDEELSRRMFSYTVLGVGGAVSLYGAKATVATFLSILPPSAKVTIFCNFAPPCDSKTRMYDVCFCTF